MLIPVNSLASALGKIGFAWMRNVFQVPERSLAVGGKINTTKFQHAQVQKDQWKGDVLCRSFSARLNAVQGQFT